MQFDHFENQNRYMKPTDKHGIDKKSNSNPNRPRPLTPELLRNSSGLHDLTDEEAAETIESLYALARILLTATLPEKLNTLDNQFVVNFMGIEKKTEKVIPLSPLPKQNDIAA